MIISSADFDKVVTLMYAESVTDEFGHASQDKPVKVCDVYAKVVQMSATKTMMTYQQADVVGVDIYLWTPTKEYNGVVWDGHEIHFSKPELIDRRGMQTHIQGYYQIDNPR